MIISRAVCKKSVIKRDSPTSVDCPIRYVFSFDTGEDCRQTLDFSVVAFLKSRVLWNVQDLCSLQQIILRIFKEDMLMEYRIAGNILEDIHNGKLYIIYDEVHHIGVDKTEPFLREITRKASKRVLIGLTATVYRYDSPIDSFNRWFKCGWDNKKQILVKDNSTLGESVDAVYCMMADASMYLCGFVKELDEEALKKADISSFKTLFTGHNSFADKVSMKANSIFNAAARTSGTYKSNGTYNNALSELVSKKVDEEV